MSLREKLDRARANLAEARSKRRENCKHPRFDAHHRCVKCGLDAITATLNKASKRHLD